MASVSKQYQDYRINVKLSKDSKTIVQVLDPLDLPDGKDLSDEELIHQALHGTLCRTLISDPDTDYYINAVENLGNHFLQFVAESARETVCWQIQKIGKDNVILAQSGFISQADLPLKADIMNKPWFVQSLVKPTRATKVKKSVKISYGFTEVKETTSKTKV